MSPEQIAALIEESQAVEPVYRSRVYGYQIEKGKSPVIITSEAEVIRMVVQRLAAGSGKATEILEQITFELRAKNVRSRSKRHFGVRELAGLVRPYYSGQEINSSGILCPGSHFPPIITAQEYSQARKRLK